MEIEILSDFDDPGITMPRNYTLLKSEEVDTTKLGEYVIEYTILDDGGVTAKIITRIVSVVDSIPQHNFHS